MTTTPAAAARERMTRVDTAWLRMDNDVNLMMIVGVWLLTPALDYETLCRRVEDKLLRYDRFRQAVEFRPNEILFHSWDEIRSLQGVGKELKEHKIADHRPTSASA